MTRTRAQSVGQEGPILSSTPKHQGKGPENTKARRYRRRASRLQEQQASPRTECNPHSSSAGKALPQQRGTKRPAEALDHDPETVRKQPRRHPTDSAIRKSSDGLNPIGFWAREGQWPPIYFKFDMEHIFARKKLMSSLRLKRSSSATSATPSDQRPREEKSAPYRDPRYETLLGTKGSFMVKSKLGITSESMTLCRALLEKRQTAPENSLFRDNIFESTCQKIHNRNEARVIQDITRLIVPSAESLATFGAKHLDPLIESVNEGWNSAIPLTNTRPQPDYSVGFKREAFTDDQLAKLSPFIGDFITGDLSFFMATYYMYFPFFSCEVKCGAAALDVADRQNAHSMTLAVRAVVELFRAVKREGEVHRQILAFSVSHDHRSVRIYGHYAVIDGKDAKYYRHPIHTFDFTALDGKDKWTAYRFTKNVYDVWMPTHFERICSAIDQLPSELNFDVPSLPEAGLSQDLESLMQSDVGSASLPVDQRSQSSNAGQAQAATPGTSFTEPQLVKKRRGV